MKDRTLETSTARGRWLHGLAAELQDRAGRHLQRRLHVVESGQGPEITVEGKRYLQFCSNNYLGLANDPEVIDAARIALGHWGVGAGASRLVAGSMALHHELETALAGFKGAEAALLFPSGFMANLALLTTFACRHDRIVSDKYNHASLLDAARFSGAEHRVFPHGNLVRAAEILRRPARRRRISAATQGPTVDAALEDGAAIGRGGTAQGANQIFMVTDSAFSMDGDLADLPAICDLADEHGALLMVDEAHALGVFGAAGSGLIEAYGVTNRVAAAVGTLSKALGGAGGFIAAPRAAIDMIINKARPFIYTTALPPAWSAAGLAALRIVAEQPGRRQRLLQMAQHVRISLEAMGYNCGHSRSQIIPVMAGSAEAAMTAATQLRAQGIFIPAIRPPTVAPNTSRLRISLMFGHTDAHIERLLRAFAGLGLKSRQG